MTTLSINVPSRRRSGNVERILKLIPTARFVIAKDEEASYATHTKQYVCHPNLNGVGAIRNWILENDESDIVVMCDDDLEAIYAIVGKKPRKIEDPTAIRNLIENAGRVSKELNIGLFSFNRDANPMNFSANRPYHFTGQACALFGVLDKTIRFDEGLEWMEDIDYTLKHLLKNRITLHDRRFYADFGAVGEGEGGLQGRRHEEAREANKNTMKQRWKNHIQFTRMRRGRLSRNAVCIKVERENKLVES